LIPSKLSLTFKLRLYGKVMRLSNVNGP